MSILSDLLVGQHSKTRQKGSQRFQEGKRPLPFEKLITQMLVRAFAGTLAKPPNTAISVPTQQALSALQGGGMGMATAYGIGGQPPGQTGGLQTRAQMGLPDRSTYFGDFMPTSADLQKLGVPPLPVNKKDRAAKQKAKGPGGKQARKGAQSPGE